jgi:hypothetical protein
MLEKIRDALAPYGLEYIVSMTPIDGPGNLIVVYADKGDFNVACLDGDGIVLWSRSASMRADKIDPKRIPHTWGTAEPDYYSSRCRKCDAAFGVGPLYCAEVVAPAAPDVPDVPSEALDWLKNATARLEWLRTYKAKDALETVLNAPSDAEYEVHYKWAEAFIKAVGLDCTFNTSGTSLTMRIWQGSNYVHAVQSVAGGFYRRDVELAVKAWI